MNNSFKIIRNINSSISISPRTQMYCIYDTWTYPVTSDIPIYLVDPITMDGICPPERSRGIPWENNEIIAGILDEFLSEYSSDRLLENIDSILERIERYSSSIECLGVFITEKDLRTDIGEVNLPAIFICPERIREHAKEISGITGINVETVFKGLLKSVIIHEQTHAYSWKKSRGETYNKYRELHVRVVEETLAQYTAYSHMKGYNRVVFTKLVETQPLEYRTWKLLVAAPSLYERTLSFIEVSNWADYIIHNKLPPLIISITIPLPSLLIPLIIYNLRYLHWLSIRYGFHEFFHEVMEPIMVSIKRTHSNQSIKVEKLVKLNVIILLRYITRT